MIGNNACGSRALGYGRTVRQRRRRSTSSPAAGRAARLGRAPRARERRLAELPRAWSTATSATIRTEFGRFGRQVSGYALEHLLPENGFDVARFLVGTEGTLARRHSGATVRLVADAPPRRWSCSATRHGRRRRRRTRRCCRTRPVACEGLDARIVDGCADVAGRRGARAAARRGLAVRRAGRRRPRPRSPRRARRVVADAGALDTAGRHRPGRAGRAVADPRGRRRAGARTARPPGARRLGGRRRAAGAARRLPARLRRAAGEHGLRRRAVRPLRRRLRARPDRLPARRRRRRPRRVTARSSPTPPSWSRLRRLAVGRARRRPGPPRTAAADVLRRGARPVRRGQGASSTRTTCSTPACSSTRRRSTPTCGWPRRRRAGRTGAGLPARRRRLRRGGAPLHRGRQVPSPTLPDRRRDVPVVPGHPGGEGLHPRPRPGAAGDARAGRPGARLARPEVHEALDLCLSCKGCARDCPTGVDMATYKSEVLHQSTAAGCARARTTRSGWLPRWAGWPRGCRGWCNRCWPRRLGPAGAVSAGVDQRREPAAVRPRARSASLDRPSGGRRPASLLCADSFTDYFSPEVGGAAVPGARGRRYQVRIPATTVLRADLDHDRPARRRPQDPRRTVAHAAPLRRRRRARRRAGAVLHGGAARRRARAARRPGAPSVSSGHPHARRTARPRPRAGPAVDLPALEVVAQPHCHHARCWAGRPTPAAGRRRCEAHRLGGCCGWPATSAWSRATTTCRSPSPSSSCCPPSRPPDPEP